MITLPIESGRECERESRLSKTAQFCLGFSGRFCVGLNKPIGKFLPPCFPSPPGRWGAPSGSLPCAPVGAACLFVFSVFPPSGVWGGMTGIIGLGLLKGE